LLAQPPANRWDPSGMEDVGWICRWGVVTPEGGRWGWRGFTGLSEPGYNGGGAGAEAVSGVSRGRTDWSVWRFLVRL